MSDFEDMQNFHALRKNHLILKQHFPDLYLGSPLHKADVGQRGKPVGSRHTSPDGTVYEKKASGKWEPVKSGRRQGPQAPDSSVGQRGKPVGSRYVTRWNGV